MAAKDEVGRYGEGVVARRLAADGWEVIARNWRCPYGEIDIVAVDAGDLVVVEVKTRRSATFGSPQEAVTGAKVRRLRRLAGAWLASQPRGFAGVRIDVAAVTLDSTGGASVEHLRGVG